MSGESAKSDLWGRVRALERRVKAYEDRIAFLEKAIQDHAHVINDQTIMAIAAFVKQDIIQSLTPAPPEPQGEEQQGQAEQAG